MGTTPRLNIDANYAKVSGGITDDANETVQPLRMNPVTNRLLVDSTAVGGATTPYIYNVTLDSANTEYSQALPANTQKYKIYAMDWNKQYPHTDVLKYCFTVTASGTTFIPIPAGSYDYVDGVTASGTLYFQSSTGSAKVIIMAWV